jgi:alanine racemase
MSGRPTTAYIDLEALAHNLTEVRRLTGGRGVLGVVKADAYGHGAVEVARRLEALGVEMLGVALVEEGIELRAHGIKSPILVLGGVFMDQAAALIANDLSIALYTAPLAEAISRAAVIAGVKVPVHVKVDTGMGRVGVSPDEAADFVKAISRMPGLEVAGLMTHLADVGDTDKSFAEFQIKQFESVIDRLKADGLAVPLIHAAGSAAVIEFAPALFNLTRPGIMLYGCYPSEHMKPLLDLSPVMSVKTKVMHIKRVDAGKPISYGRTFYTMRKSLIATLPIGYADGLSRGLSNKGHILIGGRRCPIVGTVCMDLTMVDVTEVESVNVGDEAVFIGRQGDEVITAEEVAGLLDTISYEVLCGVSKRVPREYA